MRKLILLYTACMLIFAPVTLPQSVVVVKHKGVAGPTWTLVHHTLLNGATTCTGTSTTCTMTIPSTAAGNVGVLGSTLFWTDTTLTFSSATVGASSMTECASCRATQAISGGELINIMAYILSLPAGATSVTITVNKSEGNWSLSFSEFHLSSGTPFFDTGNSTTNAACSSCAGAALPGISGTKDVIVQAAVSGTTVTGVSGGPGAGAFLDLDSFEGTGYAAAINTVNTSSSTWTTGSSQPFAGSSLAIGSGPAASFAFVSGSTTACFGGSGPHPLSKCVFAWHVNPGAKSLIGCNAFWSDSGNSISVTLTGSNNGAYTPIVDGFGNSKQNDGAFSYESFQVLSSISGAETITFQLAGGNTAAFAGFICDAYSHAGGSPIQDGTPVFFKGNASGTTATVGPINVSNAAGVMIAHCIGVATSCTAGAGFTGRNDTTTCDWDTIGNTSCLNTTSNYNTQTGGLIEDKFNSAVGSRSATFTTGSGDAFVGALVDY